MVDRIANESQRTIASMLTGDKNLEGTNYNTNVFQKVYGVVWIIIPLIIFIAALNLKKYGVIETPAGHEQHEKYNEDD